jgi:hypothetical protein
MAHVIQLNLIETLLGLFSLLAARRRSGISKYALAHDPFGGYALPVLLPRIRPSVCVFVFGNR